MTTAELEFELEDAAEAMAAPTRGQAGRYPARRLPSHLRRQGFIVTRHFLDRLRQRAQAQGIRFDPRRFADDFRAAAHYQQTRPGYKTRFALMRGLPVLYRMGGRRGLNPVLVGLLPQGALPPSRRTAPPRLRELELEQELEFVAREMETGTEGEAEQFFGTPLSWLSSVARRFWSYWGRQLAIAKRAFTEQRYGCWCGKGNVCSIPVDSLDRCCQAHDNAYGAVGVGTPGGVDMWTLEGLKRTVASDEALVRCSTAAINNGTPYGPAPRAYHKGIVAIFGTRTRAGRAALSARVIGADRAEAPARDYRLSLPRGSRRSTHCTVEH
jgi:Phospholipase A2